MTRFFAFALLAVAACGAEVEPTSDASNGTPADRSDTKKEPERAGTAPPPASSSDPTPAPAPAPLVRVKNTSVAPRWIMVDAQSTPLEFDVGDPPLQLNGYGAYWCNGPKDLHNDPMKRFARIDAGELGDIYWRAISVTRNGDCWTGTPLAAGAYPTKACFYESDPTANANAPKTCVDVTLTIASSGESVLDL